ncbi:MAG TPA: cupredoxin domain-containing protein [Vicinamibacterales bacterium]|jgi:cytochrome c oxidase subunit 2|nr:cupredoxin domain-containing protein [Vicinamibacterales bacterium]
MRPLNRMSLLRGPSLRLTGGLGIGFALVLAVGLTRPAAQEQAPERRDLTITAKDFRFSPNRVEVGRDDLLRLTVKSEDVAYGFTIDEYRVAKRVPAGGSVVLELRADREGTFAFYSNLTNDSRHSQMRGELIVRRR